MTILDQVRTLLDEAAVPTFWTNDHLLDAINEAHLTNWLNTKYRKIVTPMVVPAGATAVALPDDIVIPQIIEDSDREFWISSLAQLEQSRMDWRAATPSVPEWFVRLDARTVMPWPMPDYNYQYNVVGVGWPTEITTNSQPAIPDGCQSAIVYRAAANLLEQTQPALAVAWAREAFDAEQSYKRQQRNSLSHNLRRLKPATNKQDRARLGIVAFGQRI